MACELPYTLGLPLSRLSLSEIRRAAVARGIVASIGTATLWRWLSEDAIRPWFHRSWIFPRDPDFARKAGRVLDLYHGLWDGRDLGHREYVICADEKTSIQARRRPVASQPPAPARRRRVEHEYERMGALAYLAAWDVHRARLFGRCERQTGIEPFDHLVDQVMAQEPYRSAHRVFWIVDNGSSHRGERAASRLRDRWPRLVLVHLPVHASWLNQIEIYFSILQRKVLTPNEFNSLEEAEVRILRFQAYYQEIAQPFQWRFTRQDLEALLKRVDADRVVHDSRPPGHPASPEYVTELTA